MSTNENTARGDVYQRVTDSIIKAIETGAGTYRMPWTVRADRGFSPISIATVKPYRGINTLVLWGAAQSQGYGSALWGTYQQWQAIGAQVRKGEHGSPVVYWGTYQPEGSTEETEDASRQHLFCKGYTVFNLEQVDGVKLPKRLEPRLSTNERIERAEAFFASVGVEVKDGGNRAYYRPSTPEAVYMPAFDQFPEPLGYYSVLAHETTHWTSHDSRCARELGKRFGSEAYAMEELIAELGSAYTMAGLELELTPRADHAQYIASWLRVLRSDKRAIFTAASQAQKAADWLAQRAAQRAEVAA